MKSGTTVANRMNSDASIAYANQASAYRSVNCPSIQNPSWMHRYWNGPPASSTTPTN